jgi:transcriptional regulator with XRE-family HTH domain
MPPVVDPLFGARLRELRHRRGLSLRDLGKLAASNRTTLWELENGRSQPTVDLAARLDDALGASGELATMVVDDRAALDPYERDRLDLAADNPRRADASAATSLAVVLAGQRRLEDAVGSAAMLAPVDAQMVTIEALAGEARGPVRRSVLDVGAQWAQFAGWLSANTGRPAEARRWYLTALEWATEIGDPDMIATALNMRGHLAWLAGQPGPIIGLYAAAARQEASPGVLSLAVQQEARGHALVGDSDDVDRLLDRAVELSAAADANPDDEPPWVYFHNLDYLRLARTVAAKGDASTPSRTATDSSGCAAASRSPWT